MKRIFLASPEMNGKEIEFVNEAFKTNWIAPVGPNIEKFEKELSSYVGINHAVALSSGTSAIHLALRALDVKEGDTVFCSSLTFAASANPILYQNAKPVFIDSEKDTWNIDPDALLEAILSERKLPKAVIIVHLYGQSAKIDEIQKICKMFDIPIIEDAAESLGATYKGQQTGTFGELGIFSFNGNKIITTSGGGMLISNNKYKIDKARFWSMQSREDEIHYEHKEIGYNYRMSNVSAGIGRGQLLGLDEKIYKKKKIFEFYENELGHFNDIEMMPIHSEGEPNYWLSCLTFKETNPLDVIKALETENIESRPIWKPLHLQPVFKDCKFYTSPKNKGEAISEIIYKHGICLPSDTNMTFEEIERVVGVIKNSLQPNQYISCTCGEEVKLQNHVNRCNCGSVYKVLKKSEEN